jgi:predicted RNase H-like HicB family nuclease
MDGTIHNRPEFQVVFQEELDGGYSVWVPDLPGCASQGGTLEEALRNIKEAIELYLEDDRVKADFPEHQYKRQFVVPVAVPNA